MRINKVARLQSLEPTQLSNQATARFYHRMMISNQSRCVTCCRSLCQNWQRCTPQLNGFPLNMPSLQAPRDRDPRMFLPPKVHVVRSCRYAARTCGFCYALEF